MSKNEDVTSRAEISAQSAQSDAFAEAQEIKSDRDDNITTQLLSSGVEVSRPLDSDFPSLILQSSCFIIRK